MYTSLKINPVPNSFGTFDIIVTNIELIEISKAVSYMEKKREYSRNSYKSTNNNKEKIYPGFHPPINLNPIYSEDGMVKIVATEYEVCEIQRALMYLNKSREISRNKYQKKKKEEDKSVQNVYTSSPTTKPYSVKLKVISSHG